MATLTAAAPAAQNAATSAESERAYRRRVFAWAMYDWADHAYITTLAATFFPPFFIAIAAPALLAPGASGDAAQALARDTANNIYALTVSLSLFVAALIAPFIGTYADITGTRKRILILATILGGVLSSLLFILSTGLWQVGLLLYFLTQLAINLALGLNSSLLPHVARADDLDRASSLGYALGYIGGGLLLLLNTVLYLFADNLGIGGENAVRIAFFSVGVWWIVFMLPLARRVPEPPATPLAHGSVGSPARDAMTRLRHTLREIRHYRELFKMLVAFWLYSEGIGAIYLLATAYGAALGLPTGALIGTILMTQFVAFPYALMFGRIPDAASKWRSAFVSMLLWTVITLPLFGALANLNAGASEALTFDMLARGQFTGSVGVTMGFVFIAADQIIGILFSIFIGRHLLAGFTRALDAQRTVIMGLAIYALVPVWAFVLQTQAEFFMIGWLVGTVQGGTQALSRSIYADLSPRAKSGEFFGLYGLSEKFAGILGPFLYGIVGVMTHNPRDSVLSVTVFFLIGMYVLSRVAVREGAQIALAEEAQIEVAHAAD